MDMKIVGITVAILVSITVLAGVLMPVLDDATATTDTFTNEGYYTMDNLEGTHTLTWDHTAPKSVKVDDKTIDLSGLDYARAYTVFGGYNFMLRLTSGAIQLFAPAGSNPIFMQATVSAGTDMEVSITETSATFEVNSETPQTLTLTLTDSYIINTEGNGEYTMKYADKGAYITSESSIIVLIGVSRTFSGNDAGIYAIGTVEDGLDFNIFRGNNPEITVGTPDYVMTEENKHVDLYTLDKIEFTVTQNSVDYDLTYSYFLVPTEVTAERVQHLSGNQIDLMDVIPVLVIIAILLAVIALVIRSRLD